MWRGLVQSAYSRARLRRHLRRELQQKKIRIRQLYLLMHKCIHGDEIRSRTKCSPRRRRQWDRSEVHTSITIIMFDIAAHASIRRILYLVCSVCGCRSALLISLKDGYFTIKLTVASWTYIPVVLWMIHGRCPCLTSSVMPKRALCSGLRFGIS